MRFTHCTALHFSFPMETTSLTVAMKDITQKQNKRYLTRPSYKNPEKWPKNLSGISPKMV